MFALFTVVVMLIVAYCFFREGVLTSLCMTVNVFLAGLLAFNFYEPVASGLEGMVSGSFLDGCEDALALFVVFAPVLGVLRLITHNLANTEVEMPALVQQIVSVVVGLLCGYLLAGFLVCLLQTLPLGEHFLGFDPQVQQGGMRKVLPPDRVWLAMMSRASEGPLAQGQRFDPEGTFTLRYAKMRRKKDES